MIHLERIGVADGGLGDHPASMDNGVDVRIEPYDSVVVCATVEAVQESPRTPAFTIRADGDVKGVPLPINVDSISLAATADVAAPPALTIERTLYRLEHISGDRRVHSVAAPGGPDTPPDWTRVALRPSERLAPGALVLVSERICAKRLITDVDWVQRAPANCHLHALEWPELRQIDIRTESRADRASYSVRHLPPERQNVHEYVIVAMRPGACQFPRPSISDQTDTLLVDFTTSHARVIVEE